MTRSVIPTDLKPAGLVKDVATHGCYTAYGLSTLSPASFILNVLSDVLEAADLSCPGPSALVSSLQCGQSRDPTGTSSTNVLYHQYRVTVVQSYLSSQSQSVHQGVMSLTLANLVCRVPQGSVLGPMLSHFVHG